MVVDDFDDPINRESVTIELDDLPLLSTIELEDSQLFGLELKNLPRLAEILPISTRTALGVNMFNFKPNGLWLDRISMSGVPKLSQMKVFAVDLKDCAFTEPLELRLQLFRVRDPRVMPDKNAKPIPSKQVQSGSIR